MARLGVGLMVIAQKPWEAVQADLAGYRIRFRELNGQEPSKPILNVFVAVHEDAAEAQRMRDTYLQRYARSTVEHYQFDNMKFADIEGYEYYAGLARNIAKHGLDKFNGFLADLQVWGTPQQVTEQLIQRVGLIDAGALLVMLSYGGMLPDVAKANYDLFTSKVLPAIKVHQVGGDIGVRHHEPLAA